jgi:hypothetical protein
MTLLAVAAFIACVSQPPVQASSNKDKEGVEVFTGKEGTLARVECAKYQLIGMNAMESFSAKNIDRLQSVLNKLRPWKPPNRIPPPVLPGFEERITLSVNISGRRVSLKLGVTPGREFIYDEAKSVVYEVPDAQQEVLRNLLAPTTKKASSGAPLR